MKLLLFVLSVNVFVGSLGKPTSNDIKNINQEIVDEDPDDARRIRGGTQAKSKQFPYLVSLQSEVPESLGKFSKYCGGSIVAPNWILTAAHCCTHLERRDVENSTWARAGVTEGYATTTGYQIRKIKQYFAHEAFNATTKHHDICLMKLEKPFIMTNYVNKIEMAPNCESKTKRGYIGGFGKVSKDKHSDSLNFAAVDVLDFPSCVEYFPNILKEYHICPGEADKGSCQGDSGGPFIQEDTQGNPCLKGIASYGKKNCEVGKATVYLRPESYVDWLKKIMAENS